MNHPARFALALLAVALIIIWMILTEVLPSRWASRLTWLPLILLGLSALVLGIYALWKVTA